MYLAWLQRSSRSGGLTYGWARALRNDVIANLLRTVLVSSLFHVCMNDWMDLFVSWIWIHKMKSNNFRSSLKFIILIFRGIYLCDISLSLSHVHAKLLFFRYALWARLQRLRSYGPLHCFLLASVYILTRRLPSTDIHGSFEFLTSPKRTKKSVWRHSSRPGGWMYLQTAYTHLLLFAISDSFLELLFSRVPTKIMHSLS